MVQLFKSFKTKLLNNFLVQVQNYEIAPIKFWTHGQMWRQTKVVQRFGLYP